MEIERDFKELLELLNSHEVEYIIVGGFALAFHGAPRFTGDLDIFLKADPENAKRVVAALSDFGFGSVGLSEGDFTVPSQVIRFGRFGGSRRINSAGQRR
jgi:nucleotidyltransferase AbiEii toxin of type IV toxin-antitoxin system